MKNIFSLIVFALFISCKHEKVNIEPDTGYPADISKILVSKCAVDGCHNSISRSTAGGLDFSTWDVMFDGGRNGTSVIPFSVDYSFMLYTVNTDSTRGPVLLPNMPYLRTPLNNEEYQALVSWIANGAPDKNGFVKFSDDPNRKKAYICMQGCDKVAVVDIKTKVIMRYLDVGIDPNNIEAPHEVKVSPDGNFWYAIFYSGSVLQKFRTTDDSLVASLDIGFGIWNTLVFTPDGHKGFINGTGTNTTKVLNLDAMTVVKTLTLDYPHGGFVTDDAHYLYLTCQTGNFINKIDITDTNFYDYTSLVLIPGQQVSTNSTLDPHQIEPSPDGSKYFVSCQKSNEVRVFQTSNDSLLAVIPVGVKPQEFDVSTRHPYMFITCMEEPVSSTQKGMVYVINYNDLSIAGTVYSGYQPHGIAVDDAEDLVYVANLNYDQNGPAPHHVTTCGGRNGNLTIFNMSTLQLYYKTLSDGSTFQYKNELLAFPYDIEIRE